MDDLISRQAAIREYQEVCKGIKCDECPFLIKVNAEKGSHLITDCKLEAFLHDLPSAQPEQRWIPVTERLPLYGQDVLAVRTYWDGEKCQEVLMAHIAVWDEETGEKWWNATNITHWMPLPESPKEE